MYLGLKDLKYDVVCRFVKVYIFKYLYYFKIYILNILDVFFFGEKEVLSKVIERILINIFE